MHSERRPGTHSARPHAAHDRAARQHDAHGHHDGDHHRHRQKKSPWPLVIGAGVAALLLPFVIMLIGGGSYYRDQQPDALAEQAEQQFASGDFSGALSNANLALLRNPDSGTRDRLVELKKKLAAASERSRDKDAVALAERGAEAIRDIDRQYPAATRTQPATRELTRVAKRWLDRFEPVARANPELEPLVKEMQTIHDVNKIKAQLERADDASDLLFSVERRLALATPMWRESLKSIVDYVASHPSDPQIHILTARKVEITDKARAAFDRHETSARSYLGTGNVAEAQKQLEGMRNATVVPAWSSRADALERDIAAKK